MRIAVISLLLLTLGVSAQNKRIFIGFNFVNFNDYSTSNADFQFSPLLGLEVHLQKRIRYNKTYFDYGVIIGYNELAYKIKSIDNRNPIQDVRLRNMKIGIPLSFSLRLINNKHGIVSAGFRMSSSILFAIKSHITIEFRPAITSSYWIRSKGGKFKSSIDMEIGVSKYMNLSNGLNPSFLAGYSYWF